MPLTVEHVTEEALALSVQERAQVAHALLQSLEPAEERPEVEGAWDAEIARRVGRVHKGTATGRTAEDVFRDIRARVQ